jgi:phosphoribosyl-ATP pyrophosphohydrolase/phosphoribosyl-AMP cyclohydrolase
MSAPFDAETLNQAGDWEPATLPERRILRPRDLAYVNFGSDGLVPVIAQHAKTGEVLMLAYANRTSLALTLDTGQMYYWSRSRKEIWRKGATSGNVLSLVALQVDCDADTVLAKVRPTGPTCHTGARTCFVEPGAEEPEPSPLARVRSDTEEGRPTFRGGEVLDTLWVTLRSRAEGFSTESNTVRLLADKNLRLRKLGEELVELTIALTEDDAASVTEEAADLIYHLLVALMGAGVSLHTVGAELARRAGEQPLRQEE